MSHRLIFGCAIVIAVVGVIVLRAVVRRNKRLRAAASRIGAALGQCAPYPAGD